MADLTVAQIDPHYIAVVQKYGGDGVAMLAGDAAQAADYLAKAERVFEDAAAGGALGAGIGAAIPILGELGITEVIGGYAGTYIAGVLGAFDEFGGDITKVIHNVFNPDDFTPGDYDRQRKRCIASGGLPNPGWPPDNECGCIYPSGGTSGGEWPRDPGPGKAVRGDNPYPAAMPPGMCPDANGNPAPCTKLIPTFGTFNSSKIARPKPPLTMAQKAAALGTIKHLPVITLPPSFAGKTPIAKLQILTSLADAMNAGHALMTAAKSGDADAHAAIADTASKAAAGDPTAQHALAILTVADAEQFINAMIDQWVYGKVGSR